MSNNCSLIPDSWVVLPLGEAIEPNRPRAKPRDHVGEPFVGLEHVEAHTTQLLGTVPAETMKSSAVRFQRNDVLYARMRPYLNKVWCADRNGLCSGEFIVFPDTPATCGAFLRYRLNAQDFVSFANRKTTGDRPRVDWGEIKSFPLLLPPRKEQERIADRIDELFTDLDAGVAALERVQRNLKRYRAAVLHAAVTGRLTAAWRKEHGRDDEPADLPGDELLSRILVERRRQWERRTLAGYEQKGRTPPKNWKSRYKHPAPPKTDDLPKLPKGWCWATLDHLFQSVRNGTAIVPRAESGVPILRISAVRPLSVNLSEVRYLTSDEAESADAWVKSDDLLFTRYNGSKHLCGVCGRVPECTMPLVHPDKLIQCRVVDGLVDSAFIEIAANSGTSRASIESRLRTTAGQVGVSGTDIKRTPIPLPPLAEQAAIVEAVQEKLSQIDGLEAEVEHGLKRAGRLRQAILKAAFAGRLVEQDQRDEPASALLTRLRAEREIAGPKRSEKRRKGATARRKQPSA